MRFDAMLVALPKAHGCPAEPALDLSPEYD
jgi:hypothetical protein